jgi:pyruvate-formate lyase-activating enzyme
VNGIDEERGLVFHIIHGSFVDGYGTRTTVFLKGCPLRCLWCCNPEGQKKHPELKVNALLCNACGKCLAICRESAICLDPENSLQIDREKCTNCGASHTTLAMRVAGIPDVGDSLAAVKRVVFDNRQISIKDLIDALDRNFEGSERVLKLLADAPKFGNDDDYVDSITGEVLVHAANELRSHKGFAGLQYGLAVGAIRSHITFGNVIGAFPYLLRKPAVTSLIIGVRTSKHLEENLMATDWELTPEEVSRLDCVSEPIRNYPNYVYDPVKEN